MHPPGFGPRSAGPTLNTLNLVGAPSISKFSKLRAPVRADTPTLNTLNLVWAPSISKFSKLRAPANADTPTLKTLKLVGGQPVSKCSKLNPGRQRRMGFGLSRPPARKEYEAQRKHDTSDIAGEPGSCRTNGRPRRGPRCPGTSAHGHEENARA